MRPENCRSMGLELGCVNNAERTLNCDVAGSHIDCEGGGYTIVVCRSPRHGQRRSWGALWVCFPWPLHNWDRTNYLKPVQPIKNLEKPNRWAAWVLPSRRPASAIWLSMKAVSPMPSEFLVRAQPQI